MSLHILQLDDDSSYLILRTVPFAVARGVCHTWKHLTHEHMIWSVGTYMTRTAAALCVPTRYAVGRPPVRSCLRFALLSESQHAQRFRYLCSGCGLRSAVHVGGACGYCKVRCSQRVQGRQCHKSCVEGRRFCHVHGGMMLTVTLRKDSDARSCDKQFGPLMITRGTAAAARMAAASDAP